MGIKCLNCGHEQDADQVAAINLKARLTDPDITLWTPKEQIKAILLARFAAKQRSADLETVELTGEAGTVAGRTPVATYAKPKGTLSTERETTNAIPTGQNVGDE
jgi:hypothetical protein